MHELPVTQNILEIAVRHAAAAEFDVQRITDIALVVGQLSSIVDDSVQFYWDIISQGTIAEGATLHFRRIQGELLCLACGHRYSLAREPFRCPECQSVQVEIVGGKEFYVESINVE